MTKMYVVRAEISPEAKRAVMEAARTKEAARAASRKARAAVRRGLQLDVEVAAEVVEGRTEFS